MKSIIRTKQLEPKTGKGSDPCRREIPLRNGIIKNAQVWVLFDYQGLLNNAQWECDQCGLPNFSTCLFDTSKVMNTNTCNFDSSTNSSFCEGNIRSPSAACSPIKITAKQSYHYTRNKRSDLPLRIIVVNCQSIGKNKCDIDNLIETTKPDIIIGN